ncbi:unnamed protein product [Clonostachys rosea f. rosea IK726]|uniref:NADP-dependent oxidoreductase domain-containing protein n=2 Tax=Bionectria ochroleuca TaxID=29856 RepID=A0A0B7KLL0_BIOOC|nr:unnamed protein product [Clonostachys rosea f. rosea IK726]
MPQTTSGPLLRRLGQNGPRVPAVGLGLMGVSMGYGPIDSDEQRLKLLDRAWELGCTSWDTADVYGDSETLIGKWFKLHPERRKDIFLATKFGLKEGPSGELTIDSSPENCKKCIKESLRRLGVEFIDLYYLHRPTVEIPIEKSVEAMKDLVQKGLVKYIGLSEVSSTTLRRAHAVFPISAVQVEYSPWTMDIEGPSGTYLLKTCEELEVSVFAFCPLGSGIMTGRYRSAADFGADDLRPSLPRYKEENLRKNLELVDKFGEIANNAGHKPSQMALAWLLAQSNNVFVIPGTKKIPYLEENWGAAYMELVAEENQQIRRLVTESSMSGERDKELGHYLDTVPL